MPWYVLSSRSANKYSKIKTVIFQCYESSDIHLLEIENNYNHSILIIKIYNNYNLYNFYLNIINLYKNEEYKFEIERNKIIINK